MKKRDDQHYIHNPLDDKAPSKDAQSDAYPRHLSFSDRFNLPTPITQEAFNRMIGQKINALRKDECLTLADLGVVLEVSGQQVLKYEKGIDSISVYKLMRCAHFFYVDYDYFFE